jgi:hypothetical protein
MNDHAPASMAQPYAVWDQPMADEILLGFTLRHDVLNGAVPLMVAADIHGSHGLRAFPGSCWATGDQFDLPLLAARTRNKLSKIELLTFMPALRALTGQAAPSIRTFGPMPLPRFCPRCWQERMLIRRSHFLPLVDGCAEHGCRLLARCPCGLARRLLDLRQDVFEPVCGACDRPWRDIEPEALTSYELARDVDLYTGFEAFLGLGAVDFRARGLRVFEVATEAARRLRGNNVPTRRNLQNVSVARLVELFLAYSIDPALLIEFLGEDRPRPGCPNATCPYFVPRPVAGTSDPLRADLRDKHCHHCGVRFQGRRIISAFDLGHGGERGYPRAATVRRAQRRLEGWRRELRAACRTLLEQGELITSRDAFRLAGIPANANLRATRLGLTDIVRDAARRQRLILGSEPAVFAETTSMESYLRLRTSLRVGAARPGGLDRIALPPLWPDRGRLNRSPAWGVLRALYPLREIDALAMASGIGAARSRVAFLRERFGDDAFGSGWIERAVRVSGLQVPARRRKPLRAAAPRLAAAIEALDVSEGEALDRIAAARHFATEGCARCGGTRLQALPSHGSQVLCADCYYRQLPTTGTLLHGTRAPLRSWVMAIRLSVHLRGISSSDLEAAQLFRSSPNGARALRRIRMAMSRLLTPLRGEVVVGRVEAGGPAFGSRQGVARGWPLVVLTQQGTGRVRLIRMQMADPLAAIVSRVDSEATIVCIDADLAAGLAALHPRVALLHVGSSELELVAKDFCRWFQETHLQAPNGIEPFLDEFALYREFPPDHGEVALLTSLLRPERHEGHAGRRVNRVVP